MAGFSEYYCGKTGCFQLLENSIGTPKGYVKTVCQIITCEFSLTSENHKSGEPVDSHSGEACSSCYGISALIEKSGGQRCLSGI